MKKLLSIIILAAIFSPLAANAENKTTKVYSNKFINVSVDHPTMDSTKNNLPETETEKKLKETKTSIEATKKNISALKSIWGVK